MYPQGTQVYPVVIHTNVFTVCAASLGASQISGVHRGNICAIEELHTQGNSR